MAFVAQYDAHFGKLFTEVFVPQTLVCCDILEILLIVLAQVLEYFGQVLGRNDLIISLLEYLADGERLLAPLPKILNLTFNHLLQIFKKLNGVLIYPVEPITAILMHLEEILNFHQLTLGLEYFLTAVCLLAAESMMVTFVADAGDLGGSPFWAF